MPTRPPERFLARIARAHRWLILPALFALMPKCLLCVLAYAGLGAALGIGGPELCGDPARPMLPWAQIIFPVLGVGIGAVGFVVRRRP